MAGPMSAARSDGREPLREPFVRQAPVEPDQKYAIPDSERDRGMDYCWAATKIRGVQSPRLSAFIRAGWQPARAAAHPRLSGLDIHIDPTLVELGVMQAPNPDGPVILDDQMLMVRPKSLSDEARRQDKERARRQIDDHMTRLDQNSRRHIGDRTRLSRSYGPADEAPSDSEMEI